MEPPSGPRATSLHEFHSVGGQSDMGSDIEETTDDNFFGIGPNVMDDIRGWLLCEHGAGSGERGFLILIFKISDNHGKGDLLPWS
jgi:hypothetical protein